MKIMLSRPIATPILLSLAAAALLWFFDSFYGKKQVTMAEVGGKMNNCTCSQRLEK